MTKCIKCDDDCKPHAWGLCNRCYMKRYRTSNCRKSMVENKDCSLFLGVYVAERVLSMVFKDIQKMPMKHSGYDFICNKGKKIDVKSSVTYTRAGHLDHWKFNIKRNAIADYFLCIAFDNRDDLNPKHVWLLPSDLVNDRISITISTTTIDKWDEYRIPIDKTIACCNELKDVSA